VASEQLADHVTMVELDRDVAAVWRAILNGESKWLANRIARFNLTAKAVETALSQPALSLRERAFQTILKNRVNRGGILALGAGRLKQGENGKGMRSRWYPQTLRKRMLGIVALRDRINFIQGDGLEILRQNAQHTNALYFIDPPYTAAGKKAGSRLYTHHELDHDELFRLTAQLSGGFLMTYDDTEEVRDLARQHDFDVQAVVMKNTHHTRMTELLIGRNLDWV
jgi:DNA adenine methylase